MPIVSSRLNVFCHVFTCDICVVTLQNSTKLVSIIILYCFESTPIEFFMIDIRHTVLPSDPICSVLFAWSMWLKFLFTSPKVITAFDYLRLLVYFSYYFFFILVIMCSISPCSSLFEKIV
ncbi:hypothetical protein O6H91_Y319500 [Diphasiastrum complanatum]|nr:hypothetical protein O6H91_Y319500 [Diphasiastrum complanatum]